MKTAERVKYEKKINSKNEHIPVILKSHPLERVLYL